MYIGGPGLRRNMRLLRRNTAVLGRNTAVHVLRRNMRLLRGNTAVLRGSLTPPPPPSDFTPEIYHATRSGGGEN